MPHSMTLTLGLSLPLVLSCGASADKPEDEVPAFNADVFTDTGAPQPADTGTSEPTDTGTEDATDTGTESEVEDPPPLLIDGAWEGALSVTFLTDPLGSGELLEATCTGPMTADVVREEEPQISGTGECSIPADSVLAALIGSYGPFPGRTTGSVAEDESALGVIVIEIPGFESDILVDWTALFTEIDDTLYFSGEYGGTMEDLTVDLITGELVFDVTYSGTFELEQIPTP